MRFHYIASQLDGKIVEGNVEAEGLARVLENLAGRGLKPVSIEPMKGLEEAAGRKFFGGGISTTDKVFLTKYLSLMLRVGTDIFRAIDILIVDFQKPALKALLVEIRSALEKGQPFYSTFAKYPKYFSPVFVNLVKAGEASGNLESVFRNLSASLEKEQDLKNRIKAALVYPGILMGLSILILLFLITFALPRIADVFASSGFQPPLFSRVVFGVGLFIGKYIWLILGFGIVAAGGGWYFFARTAVGKKLGRLFLEKIPVIKNVFRKIATQRFAGTLASLLNAGLPIVDSLEITADAVGEDEMRGALRRIAKEGISRGLTLGEAFRKETVFPAVVTNLIAISEKTGHVDEILKTLSDFYESEISTAIKVMVSFIEPMLLLFIGGIIGLVALSIIVPIYQLVGQF